MQKLSSDEQTNTEINPQSNRQQVSRSALPAPWRTAFVFCMPASCEREIVTREFAEFAIRYQLYRELFDEDTVSLLDEDYHGPRTPPPVERDGPDPVPPAVEFDVLWLADAMESASADYGGLVIHIDRVEPVVVDVQQSRTAGDESVIPHEWALVFGRAVAKQLRPSFFQLEKPVGSSSAAEAKTGVHPGPWPKLPLVSLETAFSQLHFPYCVHLPALFPVIEPKWNVPDFIFQGLLAGNAITREEFLDSLLKLWREVNMWSG